MAITKTEVISVPVPPDTEAPLVPAAEAERQSLASVLGVMCSSTAEPMGRRRHWPLWQAKARVTSADDE